MKIFLLIFLIMGGLLYACTFSSPAYYSNNKFINSDSCIVELAFKARILIEPGSVKDSNTLARVEKNQILYVIGFEKGFARVNYLGQSGYISDQYFKENVFYQHWKYQHLMASKD